MFNDNQPIFRKLIGIIRDGQYRVVPFIGPHLSIHGPKESRLPLWTQLVDKLSERAHQLGVLNSKEKVNIQKLIDSENLIAAVDRLVDTVKEPQFRLFIEEIFDTEDKPIPPAIMELVCISWSLMVTTNLDSFIESAWSKKYQKPLRVVTSSESEKLDQVLSGKPVGNVLAKIHGTLEDRNSWILTNIHYENTLNCSPAFARALENLFLKNIFFVGFNLDDNSYSILLNQLKAIYLERSGNYFLLVNEVMKGTQRLNYLITEYGIQPIWYNTYSDEDEDEVLTCLRHIVREWVISNRANPVILKYFPELETDFVGRIQEVDEMTECLLNANPQSMQIIGFGGEGKTSLAQYFLKVRREAISSGKFEAVFGCSFYRTDTGRFINDAYASLHPDPEPMIIVSKVNELVQLFSSKPYFLILDGVEVVLNEHGEITNHHLKEIINAMLDGPGVLLLTTRMRLNNERVKCLYLDALTQKDAFDLLEKWGIKSPSERMKNMIMKHVGRHALSLRVLAGFIKSQKRTLNETLENLDFISIPDEMDLLKSNKVSRILENYCKYLSDDHLLFMKVFSLFRRPILFSFLRETLGNNFEKMNCQPMTKGDLRHLVTELRRRRLIIIESNSHISAHPTVKEYFQKLSSDSEAKKYHFHIAHQFKLLVKYLQPDSFEKALNHFELCFHAASAHEWELFHHTFYTLLNREHLEYLGNTLGAWEEYYDIALMAFPDQNYKSTPLIKPWYYKSAIARSLKLMGKSSLARQMFYDCLIFCSEVKDPYTSRYANNLLTLSTTMGHLKEAYHLVTLNVGTLKWTPDRWLYLWQLEHGFISFAYLSALRGDFETSESFFCYADQIYDGEEERPHFHDWDRIYFSDVILASSKKRQSEALEIANTNLKISLDGNWRQASGRAYRSLASIYRNLYFLNPEDHTYKEKAKANLKLAIMISEDIFLPPIRIEVILEKLRLDFVDFILSTKDQDIIQAGEASDYILEAESIMNKGNLFIYKPELLAARGWLRLAHGDVEGAKKYCKSSLDMAARQGNMLVVCNYNWLLEPLISRTQTPLTQLEDLPPFRPAEELASLDLTPREVVDIIDEISLGED